MRAPLRSNYAQSEISDVRRQIDQRARTHITIGAGIDPPLDEDGQDQGGHDGPEDAPQVPASSMAARLLRLRVGPLIVIRRLALRRLRAAVEKRRLLAGDCLVFVVAVRWQPWRLGLCLSLFVSLRGFGFGRVQPARHTPRPRTRTAFPLHAASNY